MFLIKIKNGQSLTEAHQDISSPNRRKEVQSFIPPQDTILRTKFINSFLVRYIFFSTLNFRQEKIYNYLISKQFLTHFFSKKRLGAFPINSAQWKLKILHAWILHWSDLNTSFRSRGFHKIIDLLKKIVNSTQGERNTVIYLWLAYRLSIKCA